jgi:hypothetical protein
MKDDEMTGEDQTSSRSSRVPRLSSTRFAQLVADLNPSTWAVTRRRIDAIEQILATEKPGHGAIGEAAKMLGMDRRHFTRVMEAYRAVRREGGFESHAGRKRVVPAEVENLISKVAARLGPAASSERVHRQVVAECQALGIRPPGISAIRVRLADPPACPDVRAALARDADLFLDVAPLRLPLRIGERSETAHFTALVDAASSAVMAHALTPGEPSVTVVHGMAAAVAADADASIRRLAHTRLVRIDEAMTDLLKRKSIVIDHASSRGLSAGSVLRAVFGGRIGRIKILERDPVSFLDGEPVAIEDARAVVDLLVSRRNASALRAGAGRPPE